MRRCLSESGEQTGSRSITPTPTLKLGRRGGGRVKFLQVLFRFPLEVEQVSETATQVLLKSSRQPKCCLIDSVNRLMGQGFSYKRVCLCSPAGSEFSLVPAPPQISLRRLFVLFFYCHGSQTSKQRLAAQRPRQALTLRVVLGTS